MQLSLSILLPFHWMVAFCLFAALCAGGADGFGSVMLLLADIEVAGDAINPALSLIFGSAYVLSAALFLWCTITAVVGNNEFPGEYENIAGVAFGLAIAVVTAMLIVSAPQPGRFVVAAAFLVGGLAASYAAVISERRAGSLMSASAGDQIQAAVRIMALGAAHSSMLSKISGRYGEAEGDQK